jgi:L-rhamnose mutarotase
MNNSTPTPVYGSTNPAPAEQAQQSVARYGSVIELIPAKEQEYRQLHAEVWHEVQVAIKKANIQNYNLYVAQLGGKKYLFSYFEYTGNDAQKDFASIADDPTTKDRWWPLTDACQQRLPDTPEGEQWLPLETVMQIQ